MERKHRTRREFLRSSGATVTAMALGMGSRDVTPRWFDEAQQDGAATLRDPRVKALALRALDAARSAGASYADVRLTYTRSLSPLYDAGRERLGIGIRALVDGYWGFTSSPVISDAEASRLGQQSASFAKSIASRNLSRRVELGSIRPVIGDWTTPGVIDPFTIATEEMVDWWFGLQEYAKRFQADIPPNAIHFNVRKQDRVFASSEDSYVTQTVYATGCECKIEIKEGSKVIGSGIIDCLKTVGAGWEAVLKAPVFESLPHLIEQVKEEAKLPFRPLDIGRYDVVFDVEAMASLLANTLGAATELDRVLGYEANEAGTSYLGPDPLEFLGTEVASPLLTVTANRSVPRGLATIKWDDEGVAPVDFMLIKDGVLTEYQTIREQAAWLASWYQRRGLPVRSHGCAAANDAQQVVMQHIPNLTMAPGTTDMSVDDLVAEVKKGVAIRGLKVSMDQQCKNGMAWPGEMFHIKDGKRVARVAVDESQPSVAILFRAPEVWKTGLMSIGGRKSQCMSRFGYDSRKGHNNDNVTGYSIEAVPAMIKQLTFIDPSRKA